VVLGSQLRGPSAAVQVLERAPVGSVAVPDCADESSEVELQNPEELIAFWFAPAGVGSPAPPACWPQQQAVIFPLDSGLIELLGHADPRSVFQVSRFIGSP